MSGSYSNEQIFEACESLHIDFVYDLYSRENSSLLSIYPLINRIEDDDLPAIIGIFGLALPEGISFADTHGNRLPFFFSSDIPIRGYPFLSARNRTFSYKRTIFTVDSAPEQFSDFHVHIAIPEPCHSCGGKGCTKCNELGHVFLRRLEGAYSSEELKKVMVEIRKWQK